MDLDIKISYKETTRRLRLPLLTPPTWVVLRDAALRRHGLIDTGATISESWFLSYKDADGDSITVSSDEEVADMWPKAKPGADLQAFADTLSPLRLWLSRQPNRISQDDADDFSVIDATGDSVSGDDPPEVEATADRTQPEPDARIPPVNQASPIISVTRGIVDFIESRLQRLPLDEHTRSASNDVLESIAALGLNIEEMVDTARRAGCELFDAVREEHERWQDQQEASTGSSGADAPAEPQGPPAAATSVPIGGDPVVETPTAPHQALASSLAAESSHVDTASGPAPAASTTDSTVALADIEERMKKLDEFEKRLRALEQPAPRFGAGEGAVFGVAPPTPWKQSPRPEVITPPRPPVFGSYAKSAFAFDGRAP